MNQLHAALQDRIKANLRGQRRAVVAEDLCLSGAFLVCALVITFVTWLLIFGLVARISYGRRASSYEAFFSLRTARYFSLGTFLGIVVYKHRLLFPPDKAGPPRMSSVSSEYLDATALTDDLPWSLLLVGPRCGIIAWEYLHYSWKTPEHSGVGAHY